MRPFLVITRLQYFLMWPYSSFVRSIASLSPSLLKKLVKRSFCPFSYYNYSNLYATVQAPWCFVYFTLCYYNVYSPMIDGVVDCMQSRCKQQIDANTVIHTNMGYTINQKHDLRLSCSLSLVRYHQNDMACKFISLITLCFLWANFA